MCRWVAVRRRGPAVGRVAVRARGHATGGRPPLTTWARQALRAARRTHPAQVRPRLVDPALRQGYVVGVDVVADVAAVGLRRGDGRRPGAHERIEHEIAAERIELDQAGGELDGERGRVADPGRRRGPISHTSSDQAMKSSRPIVDS